MSQKVYLVTFTGSDSYDPVVFTTLGKAKSSFNLSYSCLADLVYRGTHVIEVFCGTESIGDITPIMLHNETVHL